MSICAFLNGTCHPCAHKGDEVFSTAALFSTEEFEKDIESYIGKKIEDFDYSEKLQAYKYIENKQWIKNILEDGSKKDKDFVNNFLSQMKDLFEL
jgi:hypothetical protein